MATEEFDAYVARVVAENAAIARERAPEYKAEAERRRREAARELNDRIERLSHIPPRYAKATLNRAPDVHTRAAVDAARSIAAGDFRNGIGLFSADSTGTGKTEIAAAIGNTAKTAGYTAKMFSPEVLYGRLIEASSYGGDEAVADVLRDIANTRVLILDDFGSESMDRRKLSWLALILDTRWNAGSGLCLVITSNWTFEELHARYIEAAEAAGDKMRGSAIMDRVRALTGTWILVGGPSRRKYGSDD